jgi:hypothetical protein
MARILPLSSSEGYGATRVNDSLVVRPPARDVVHMGFNCIYASLDPSLVSKTIRKCGQ